MAWKERTYGRTNYPKPEKQRQRIKSDVYREFTVRIPIGLFAVLKAKSEESNLPIGWLICYALDNELDSPVPFNYPCLFPSNEYIPQAYLHEAQKIVDLLLKSPKGMGRESLMLCRRNIGVVDRNTFMLALRELFENDIVIEVNPPADTKFEFSQGYKFIRIKEITGKERKPVVETKEEIDRQIEELKAKRAEM